MTQQEVHLKQQVRSRTLGGVALEERENLFFFLNVVFHHQVSLYSDKFEECHSTLSKSNEVFTTFKQEMEKVSRERQRDERTERALASGASFLFFFFLSFFLFR